MEVRERWSGRRWWRIRWTRTWSRFRRRRKWKSIFVYHIFWRSDPGEAGQDNLVYYIGVNINV